VLFSEPKIPQCNFDYDTDSEDIVSVLFSEPKIPQWKELSHWYASFTAAVSVLFSEPKIPQLK